MRPSLEADDDFEETANKQSIFGKLSSNFSKSREVGIGKPRQIKR